MIMKHSCTKRLLAFPGGLIGAVEAQDAIAKVSGVKGGVSKHGWRWSG